MAQLFPGLKEKLQRRFAVHLWRKDEELVDFILCKVAKFDEKAPALLVDVHADMAGRVRELLSECCAIEDLSETMEVIACTDGGHGFKEGQRIYIEEEGEMLNDEELQRRLTGYVSFVDPRCASLGSRIISVEDCVESESTQDSDHYRMWRMVNGIAEGKPAMKSDPFHLNFHCFDGSPAGEIHTICGAVITQYTGASPLDRSYRLKVEGLRVVDEKGEFLGKVFEGFHNLMLIKAYCDISSKALLENGAQINIWKPPYLHI